MLGPNNRQDAGVLHRPIRPSEELAEGMFVVVDKQGGCQSVESPSALQHKYPEVSPDVEVIISCPISQVHCSWLAFG
jgi:hypothetical protein